MLCPSQDGIAITSVGRGIRGWQPGKKQTGREARWDESGRIDIASAWHKRFVKTSWETPSLWDFRSCSHGDVDDSPKGCEMRVTKPVTEFQIGRPSDNPSDVPWNPILPKWGDRDYVLELSPVLGRSGADCPTRVLQWSGCRSWKFTIIILGADLLELIEFPRYRSNFYQQPWIKEAA